MMLPICKTFKHQRCLNSNISTKIKHEQCFLYKSRIEKRLHLPPMPTIGQILKIYKVPARKHLAQNFILDPLINSKIVRAASPDLLDYHVCEVGPGPGGITRAILNSKAKSLTVVEKDRRFMPSLKYLADASNGRMNIVHDDILQYDIKKAFLNANIKSWESDIPLSHIIGNLPFNISLPLLFKLLDDISNRTGVFEYGRVPLTFTFQEEVGQRLIAKAKEKQRCRLSITSQYLCDVRIKFIIKGSSFVPQPKVNAAVVKLIPRKKFLIDLPFRIVDKVTKHVFHFRQKRCLRGLSTLYPPQRDDLTEETFRISGVNPSRLPVELTINHYRDLCYAYQEICNKIPELSSIDTFFKKDWIKNLDENILNTEN